MPIDFTDPRPAYTQIADDIRTQIAHGQLKPGDKLKARKAMSEEYDVAPETLKKALDELAREGLIVTQSTRGTFVTNTIQSPPRGVNELFEELKRLTERVDGLESRVGHLEHGTPD